jgi:hypothetical protein
MLLASSTAPWTLSMIRLRLKSFILSTYPQWVLAARLRLSYPGYAVLDSLILFPAKFFVAELTMKG